MYMIKKAKIDLVVNLVINPAINLLLIIQMINKHIDNNNKQESLSIIH